ncbi:MAG: lipopolysaccharide biosynthesis protein [Chitinispirillales bacterium]|jgi:O-antigen/teichoic acid export membrane protein|nr:lipopolysaccharide biosynthesis protein [Chitinispirillales bacterium]
MRSKLSSSFFWKYLERSGSQASQFAVSIVLARLLAPNDFGVLALVMAFISVANIFVESGLRNALVQKKDANDSDFSTAFWFSLLIAVIVYAVLYFSAPPIAAFYKNEGLTSVIRVLGITLFLGVLGSVQEAYIMKNFLFKKLFFRSLAAVIPSGILGITLAHSGFGIWALVWQQLANAFLTCVFMLFMVPWKPALVFSVISARKLFNFGYKLLFSSLFGVTCVNLTNLLIGKFFTPAMLGFYNRGEQFPKHIVLNVNESINAVLFPLLANSQDNIEQFRQIMRRCVKASSFIIFPLMALLASSAKPTVAFVFGEKWLPCAAFLQVNCLILAFWPLHSANRIAMNSLGRSDMFLKCEIAGNIIGVSAMALALYFFKTPFAVILSQAAIIPIGCWINSIPNKELLNYGFSDQIKDVLPMLFCSLAAGLAVFPLSLLDAPNFVIIPLQVIPGLSIYLFLARVFKMESLYYLTGILKTSLKYRGAM